MAHLFPMIFGTAVLIAGLSAGCGRADNNSGTAPAPEGVRIFKLGSRPAERYRMFSGIIQPEEQVNLSFRLDGQLVLFNAGPGKPVTRNTLLARLDQTAFRATVDSAEAQYREALIDYERYRGLHEKLAVAASEFQKKKRDLDVAEAALRNAKEDLACTEIFAPFSGIIANTYADNYQHVKAKETLIRLQNLGSFQVSIDVPEKYFAEMSSSSIAEVNRLADGAGGFYGVLPTAPERKIRLTLKEASTEADSVTQTFRVTFRIGRPASPPLFPGMTMSVFVPDLSFRIGCSENTFDVPHSALFSRDGKVYVWKVDPKTSCVISVEVKSSSPVGAMIAVTSKALAAGDSIAVSGVNVLRDGTRVRELPSLGVRRAGAEEEGVL